MNTIYDARYLCCVDKKKKRMKIILRTSFNKEEKSIM